MALTWNEKQREMFALFDEGKSFDEVVSLGYAHSTASRVLKAFRAGERPEDGKVPSTKSSGTSPMATVKAAAAGIQVFRIGQQEIPIYPEDMLQCYDHFRDMKDLVGWESDFSSTIREGIKLLRTVIVNFTPQQTQEVNNDNTGTPRQE